MEKYKSIEIGIDGDKETGKLYQPFRLGKQVIDRLGVYKEDGITFWVVREEHKDVEEKMLRIKYWICNLLFRVKYGRKGKITCVDVWRR